MSNERTFLHDLIGPLSAARNLLEVLIEEMNIKQISNDQTKKLETILSSMDKAADLVAARREFLINSEKSE